MSEGGIAIVLAGVVHSVRVMVEREWVTMLVVMLILILIQLLLLLSLLLVCQLLLTIGHAECDRRGAGGDE